MSATEFMRQRAAQRALIEQQKLEALRAREVREARMASALNRASRRCTAERFRVSNTTVAKFVEKLAPKIFQIDGIGWRLDLIDSVPHLRHISTWAPDGKSRRTQFRSLIDHLLVKYRTPGFLYETFEAPNRPPNCTNDALLFCHIASGGSPAEAARMGLIPEMTKKQYHLWSQAPSDTSITGAVRYAQVMSFGGNRRTWEAIMQSYLRDNMIYAELFYVSVIQWICNQAMFDPAKIPLVLDYIRFKKNEDADYQMKGRTANAVLRESEAWHTGRIRVSRHGNFDFFNPSGFKAGSYIEGTEKEPVLWTITEILTSKELWREGSLMKHCVGSYGWSVNSGRTSIWTMIRERQQDGRLKLMTIEVSNPTRTIVQARGICNRPGTAKEKEILQRWAQENGLLVSTYI